MAQALREEQCEGDSTGRSDRCRGAGGRPRGNLARPQGRRSRGPLLCDVGRMRWIRATRFSLPKRARASTASAGIPLPPALALSLADFFPLACELRTCDQKLERGPAAPQDDPARTFVAPAILVAAEARQR